jgi:FkbM family methyltransferase
MSGTKKNILFIGANDMAFSVGNIAEIESYVNKYQNGLFIEAIPSVFNQLEKNLQYINTKYNTNYKAINCLVCDEIGKEFTFHIFSNNGGSSSIYTANNSVWQWPSITEVGTLQLTSTTIEAVLKEQNWENTKYDLILDVQGAELVVLKGFSESNLKNIEKITTEISTEPFYNGGVLFNDLNNFITNCGFKLDVPAPESNHCDISYSRI